MYIAQHNPWLIARSQGILVLVFHYNCSFFSIPYDAVCKVWRGPLHPTLEPYFCLSSLYSAQSHPPPALLLLSCVSYLDSIFELFAEKSQIPCVIVKALY